MQKLILTVLTSLCFLLSASVTVFSAPPRKAQAKAKCIAVAKKHRTPAESVTAKASNTSALKKPVKWRKGATREAARSVKIRGRAMAVVEPIETDGEFIEYTIKKGDTVERLAQRFGIESDDILASNSNLANKLAPGKMLLIPRIVESDKGETDYVDLPSRLLKPWKTSEEKYMLVKVAKSFMGAPYRYGGESVRGLDCSAFVKKIYDIFDVQLPRSAREQYCVGPKIAREELSVGDLVFFRTKRFAKYPTHVGIYIGDGNFIHSSSAHDEMGVKIDSLKTDFYSRTFLGGTRIKKSVDEPADVTGYSDTPLNYGYNS